MNYDMFREELFQLPVFDTHTHLNMPGVPVVAQHIWDIAHYFWFERELIAAGYPTRAMELDEETRYKALEDALRLTRNTSWNWAVKQMVKQLYDIDLGNLESLHRLNDAIRASSQQSGWAQSVIGKLGVRRITVNDEEHANMPGLPGIGCVLPAWPASHLQQRQEQLLVSKSIRADLEQHTDDIHQEIAELKQRGIRGIRVDQMPYDLLGERVYAYYGKMPAEVADPDHIRTYLFDALFDALHEQGMLAQLFLGMKRREYGDAVPIDTAFNDTARIVRLHPLFHRHPNVRFELVLGCELNNMDVVQAARIYPNVNPGGLWWFNFRVSSYLQAMQYRFEALPPNRTAILATDARCIEWCYTKTSLVKQILTQFFWNQIQQGWLNAEDALWTARWWLHDTAANLYPGAS